jgi:hypothetical protein
MASKKFHNLSDEQVWARWQERIERIRHELHYVYTNRNKFRIMTKMFEDNPKLKAIGGQIFEWLFFQWARDAIIAVRRELDPDSNTVSLGCMLDEMVERPEVLTRRRYVGRIRDESDFRWRMLNTVFDGYGLIKATDSMGDYMDPVCIQNDRDALDTECKPVKDYANRMLAHRTPIEEMPLTIGQLNKAIDVFEPMFVKYYAIVNGASLMGLEPSIIGDWTAPFRIAWSSEKQDED